MTGPLRQTQPPGFSIPLEEIAACLDCKVAFNGREDRGCVKCGSEIGIVRLRVTAIDADALRKEAAPMDAANVQGSQTGSAVEAASK